MHQLHFTSLPFAKLGKEGYTIVSSARGVTIGANETAGLFYGMQTLLQLLPKEYRKQRQNKRMLDHPCRNDH